MVVGTRGAGLAAAITPPMMPARRCFALRRLHQSASGEDAPLRPAVVRPTDADAARIHRKARACESPIPEATVDAWAEETSRNSHWILERAAEEGDGIPRHPEDPYEGDGTDTPASRGRS